MALLAGRLFSARRLSMYLSPDLWLYPHFAVLTGRDKVGEPVGQRAQRSPVELPRRVPQQLPAGSRARHRFRSHFNPQSLAEGAAHGKVQGEVGHGQQDPHPMTHTASRSRRRWTEETDKTTQE